MEQQSRDSFYSRIAVEGATPLWEVLRQSNPPEPKSSARPYVWRWDAMRPLLMEAGGLLSAEDAERRVLSLANPAYTGLSKATATLYGGLQLVLPGEIAPAHRHSQSALRFVIESDGGGYTAVDGERSAMLPGDFIITPSWTFHDHGNDGNGPVIWLDVLDVPLVGFLEAGFAEGHNAMQHAIARPEGDAMARYGAGMLPIEGGSPYGATSPLFNYPYVRTRAALLTAARAAAPDAHWGVTLRYANPLDGGWVMPTISSWMTYLPAGFTTAPLRSTDGLIVAVAEGRGRATLGPERIAFGPHDVFAAPNWTWRSFTATEDTFLFCSSDRVVHEKLGVWREERQSGAVSA